MDKRELKTLNRELTAFLDSMTDGMGRPERREAMRHYLVGLLLDGERKSIEPMAARLVDDPSQIQAMRQRLQQCVTVSTWSDEEVWRRLAIKAECELPELEAWVVDDTGFPKKGNKSVGVQRQYSGTLGRTDNCQVATSLHVASERGSLCIGFDLYLPESWASDVARRHEAGVPDEVEFRTKWQISLEQIEQALSWGLPPRVVLADAGYGDSTEYRDGLTERGLEYVVAVQGGLVAWPPGRSPVPPPLTRPAGKLGRPSTRWTTGKQRPQTLQKIAVERGRSACTTVGWREGSRGKQSSRFGAVRIRIAHRHSIGRPPGDEQWLLYEWPADEPKPTKFWLSTLPPETPIKRLVHLAKLRWRVERDYQELKQEIGLDHFEGRGWRGFHHHATLCGVAHGFLALRRALFPPPAAEVDAAPGPQAASADSPAADRVLPDVPQDGRSGEPAPRAVADVIE